MDHPPAKKRRLAPKVEAPAQPALTPEPNQPGQHYQAQDVPPAPPPPERHEFESFARHLQDAAMTIFRQTQKAPYANVSALLLRWEEDETTDPDLSALEQTLREKYHYRTESWRIPTAPNASLKLGIRTASFLENAAPDHLLIVYYVGHGYVDAGGQLYWASNSREGAARIKWDGFRCLFDEVPSDVLFLLDSCAPRDAHTAEHGSSARQIIAASGPEHSCRTAEGRSFTAQVTDVLLRLSVGRPFTAEALFKETAAQRQQELLHKLGLPNGTAVHLPVTDKLPVMTTMSIRKGQSLIIGPMPQDAAEPLRSSSQGVDGDGRQSISSRQNHVIHPHEVADLIFEESRVLVCTTFVGDASPDMSSFNSWLHNSPAMASKIAVEGMFHGPPTMLLISMPVVVWNVVQHDKVCCFLGHINSRNMTHLYQQLVGSASLPKASAKDVEHGRILLEARQLAATTPVINRQDFSHRDPSHGSTHPETPARAEAMGHSDLTSLPHSTISAGLPYSAVTGSGLAKQHYGEESAEIQEAAEQLKALSHVRHMSNEIAASAQNHLLHVNYMPEGKQDDICETNGSGMDETQYNGDLNTPSSKPKQRRSLQKSLPRQETACLLCSPTKEFRDASSLRKHVASTHTRPFPCSFAFAGCPSTFGSKNEWKRHLASQHLCLTYYRCSMCPQGAAEGKGNEFNRKDLFTQHLRRMHAPFSVKKGNPKGDAQAQWEAVVKDMQRTCMIIRRQPPQRSACPKAGCQGTFEGASAWDSYTEHVGRHMERGETGQLDADLLLAKWAVDEGIIEQVEDGAYRLCSQATGNEKEPPPGGGNNVEQLTDGDDRDIDTTAASGAVLVADKMAVDG